MGCILSQPVELIRVQRRGNASFRCAVAEMQGWRVGHEDAHEMKCEDSYGAFWVLDGHAGDGAANFGAPELVQEFAQRQGRLPSVEALEQGFANVDSRLRAFIQANPDKDSGSTVVGALIAKQEGGAYCVKLCNCGDSRGVVVRGPEEEEGNSPPADTPVGWPRHIEELAGSDETSAQEFATLRPQWPLIVESVDHKPNHPTEKARIEAAGGHVTKEDPPRLDGNLAVSRGLGDFEYKADAGAVQDQKVSCVPDIYEVSGLRAGSFLVLACDGLWDVMSGEAAAVHVRGCLQKDPQADLGAIAADLVKSSLRIGSRDNVTVMIVQLVDGSEFASTADEIKYFDKLCSKDDCLDEDSKKHYAAFLRKAGFATEPQTCSICERWFQNMNMCPCKQAMYCSRTCQKKGWKTHKLECPNAPGNVPSQKPKTAPEK